MGLRCKYEVSLSGDLPDEKKKKGNRGKTAFNFFSLSADLTSARILLSSPFRSLRNLDDGPVHARQPAANRDTLGTRS